MEQLFMSLDRSARWRCLSLRYLIVAWLGLSVNSPIPALADPKPSTATQIISILVGGTGSDYAKIQISRPAGEMAACGTSNPGVYALDERSDGGKAALATALAALAAGRLVIILGGGECGKSKKNPNIGWPDVEFLSWIQVQ